MAKTHTISEVKRRYNEKVYSKLSFQLPKDLVAEFKERCKQDGISQASVVKAAIEQYLNK